MDFGTGANRCRADDDPVSPARNRVPPWVREPRFLRAELKKGTALGLYVYVNALLVGFFAFAALHHFCAWWLSRRELVLIIFAALCFLIGGGNASLVAIASATGTTQAQLALEIGTICNALGLVANVWVLALVTGVRPRWFVFSITVFFLFVAVFSTIVSPADATATGIDHGKLPWGAEIVVPLRTPSGWWVMPTYVAAISVHAFGLFAGLRLWAADRIGGILVTLAGAGILVAIVVSGLIDLGRLMMPYFGNIPWSFYVALISLQISREYRTRGEKLAASERRFRAIFDQTFEFIGLMSVDGTLLQANRTALKFAGIEESDVIGKLFWETPWWSHSPELQERLRKAVRAAAGGQIIRFEATHPRPDGGLTYVDFSLKPVCDERGDITLLIPEARDITERKRVEHELLESNQFNKQIIESAPNGLIVMNRDFRYMVWNPKMEEMSGLRSADVLGKQPLELFPFLQSTGVLDQVTRALAGDTLTSTDFPFEVPGSGRRGWSMQIMAPLRNSANEIVGVLVSAIDVTSRKETEEKLIEANRSKDEIFALLDTLQAEAPIGLAFVDLNFRYVRCNDALAEINGVPAADHLGRLVSEVVPNIWPQIEPIYRSVTSGNGPMADHEIVGETPARPGQIRSWLVSYYPVKIHEEIIGVGVIVNEITERKRVEEALKASEARSRAILFALPDLMFRLDAEGNILDYYACDRNELYLPPELFLGKRMADAVPEMVGRLFQENLRRTLETGQLQSFEYDLEFPNGGTTSFEARMVPSGERETITIVRNITGRKKADETRQKLEAQLFQSQKMEAIGVLAGGVAHDFNNLLTVINGYSNLLLMDLTSGDPLWGPITAIRDASERASRLTQQLLAFSRKAIIEPKVVDLNELVAKSANMLRRLIGENIVLAILTDPSLAQIKADPGQLEQVIMNLVVNARDAMPTGGRLTLETRDVVLGSHDLPNYPDLKTGRYAMFAVTDTGKGMADELKSKIFEPFFTTKGIGRGTGLGLAVVHGVVKQCGGHIGVHSAADVGTTFRILFPVAPELNPVPAPVSPKEPTRGTETVLLVEDEDSVRAIARIALETNGFKVLAAPSGAEAIRLAEEHPGEIHILVTDVVMPEMGGRQLAECMRTLRPGMRVLYMSGYTDDAVIHYGVSSANDAFLQKPFTPLGLNRKVRAVLDGML
jgi:two-component system, cell cycle sensor histidine kinase and response regulator CckA